MLMKHPIVHFGYYIVNNLDLSNLTEEQLECGRFWYDLHMFKRYFLFAVFVAIALHGEKLTASRRGKLINALRVGISSGNLNIGVLILSAHSIDAAGNNILHVSVNRVFGKEKIVLYIGDSLPINFNKLKIKKNNLIYLGGKQGKFDAVGVCLLRCLLSRLMYLVECDDCKEVYEEFQHCENMFGVVDYWA